MMHYPRRVPIVTRFLPLVLEGKVSAVRVGYCNRFVMPQIDVLLDEKVLITRRTGPACPQCWDGTFAAAPK